MAAGKRVEMRRRPPSGWCYELNVFNDLDTSLRARHIVSFALLVNLLFGSAVQLGNHKVQEVAASRVGHFGRAQVLSLSLPQTFFSQATGSERIVVNVCSGRRDVLANPFRQEIGSIGHDYSPDYSALAWSFCTFAPFYERSGRRRKTG